MDLVPAGDLSEFVLTKKRLTADQAHGHHGPRAREGRQRRSLP